MWHVILFVRFLVWLHSWSRSSHFHTKPWSQVLQKCLFPLCNLTCLYFPFFVRNTFLHFLHLYLKSGWFWQMCLVNSADVSKLVLHTEHLIFLFFFIGLRNPCRINLTLTALSKTSETTSEYLGFALVDCNARCLLLWKICGIFIFLLSRLLLFQIKFC